MGFLAGEAVRPDKLSIYDRWCYKDMDDSLPVHQPTSTSTSNNYIGLVCELVIKVSNSS